MFLKGGDQGSGISLRPFILRVFRWLSSAPESPDTESAAIRRHLKRGQAGNLQRRSRCGNEKNIWHVWHQAGRNAFACRHCHDRDGFCRYDPIMETEVYINELCLRRLTSVWANLVGSLLLIILTKMKLDPAVVSSPLITTLLDTSGLLVYFSIAKWWLRF